MLTIIKKTKKFLLAALISYVIILPVTSLAVLSDAPDFFDSKDPGIAKLRDSSPIKSVNTIQILIEKIVRWFQYIFYLVAIIFIILAAFNYLTSKGEPEKVKTANKSILYAIIAITIAVIGGGFVLIVSNFIGAT